MRILVLHANAKTFCDVNYGGGDAWRARVLKALADGGYVEAAEFETSRTGNDALEAAFHLTNNIDAPWPENPEVKATGLSRRSTSVGDILVADGIIHAVASFGFDEFGPMSAVQEAKKH